MVGDLSPGPPGAAAVYLRELLSRPGRYRRRWEQYAERNRRGQVNQLAVAEVLAHYLWEHPRNRGDTDVLPRQLKDTASRALSGRLLSKSALNLFMDAFDMAEFDRDQLTKLWTGSSRVRVLTGPRAVSPGLFASVSAALGPPQHHTFSLHDHMLIGADRRPVRIRTIQVIEATEPDVDRIPYLYDTNTLSVTAGQGCRGIAEPLAQIPGGVYVTHLLLADRLNAGDTLTLEYWTTFSYPVGYQEREYRRAVLRRVESMDIRVEFDPDALPAAIWWAVWDGFEGDITSSNSVALDSQYSVHRYLTLAEKTVVGFRWDW
jgi:hypothetical protein